MSGVLCDKRVPPHVKGKIHKMIVQPAMLYRMETGPVTNSHVKKLEVTEMKMCRWACGHTLGDHVRNDDIRERLKVENITERCRKARMRWFGHVKRQDQDYIGRKTADGTTWETKVRKTEAEMVGLCQPGYESHRNDERWSAWQNWLEENCVWRSDPTTKWERLEDEEEEGEETFVKNNQWLKAGNMAFTICP